MRFFLEFRKKLGGERILINFSSRYPRSFGPIQGIIDTGSPKTIISASDALRLNIPFKSLEQGIALRGFGKGGIPTKILKNFKFVIMDEERKLKEFKTDVFVVDMTTLKNLPRDFTNQCLQTPTIFGLDILDKFKMNLFLDFENESFSLETH